MRPKNAAQHNGAAKVVVTTSAKHSNNSASVIPIAPTPQPAKNSKLKTDSPKSEIDARAGQVGSGQRSVPTSPSKPGSRVPNDGNAMLRKAATVVQWRSAAPALASWWVQYVARTDAHGGYLPLGQRQGNNTAITRREPATLDTLTRHFAGDDVGDLIGLHAVGPDGMCRFAVIDIDHHGDPDPAVAAANERGAIAIAERARELGFCVALEDSNGRGGFHVWLFFADALPVKDVCSLLQWLVRDWQRLGLAQAPELFPDRPATGGKKVGKWIRLPGRHHTHDHWSRVWDGGRWQSGRAATDYMLALTPESVVIPAEVLEFAERGTGPNHSAATTNNNTLVRSGDKTLDRVLAKLEGVRPCGDGYAALCPAHNDQHPSLSIRAGNDGRVLLHCHAGCTTEQIVESIDMEMSDLFAEPTRRTRLSPRRPRRAAAEPPAVDWAAVAEECTAMLTAARLAELVEELGVSPESLRSLGLGWLHEKNAYTFPERDGAGNIIGIALRYPGGAKSMLPSSRRGIYIPDGFEAMTGTTYLPEGASDTAALLSAGLTAVGRPSATGGVDHLVELLREDNREIIVIGDHDRQEGGVWPGRAGAMAAAQQLAKALGRAVTWVLPPGGAKDVREWLLGREASR